MRRLAWDSSFRRAFKQHTQRDCILQERIFEVLDQLARSTIAIGFTNPSHGWY